jgi:ADP-ribose pyrophosphatase YjhB (NUDIX family)
MCRKIKFFKIFLLLHIYKEKTEHFIFFRGGKEHGENLHENLKRECIEEVDIEVEVGELRFVRDYIEKHHKPKCWLYP